MGLLLGLLLAELRIERGSTIAAATRGFARCAPATMAQWMRSA
jgi:hypothetical protein